MDYSSGEQRRWLSAFKRAERAVWLDGVYRCFSDLVRRPDRVQCFQGDLRIDGVAGFSCLAASHLVSGVHQVVFILHFVFL